MVKKPFSINGYQISITIGTEVFPNFWTKMTKVEKTYGTSEYSDGQSNVIFNLPGAVKYTDVTISKPFAPGDERLINGLIRVNSTAQDFVTVSIQPMYRDGYYNIPQGGQIILEFCTVGRTTAISEIDTGGSGVSMVEAQLYPGGIKSSGGSVAWWVEPTANVDLNN